MTGYSQYQSNQIATASREQILLMLYDGAIRFAKQAMAAIDNDNMADKGKYLGKVIAIIAELSSSLNHDIGGEMAENLDALYTYMINSLSSANVDNDPEPIQRVCNMLVDLRKTWAKAIEINSRELTTPPIEKQENGYHKVAVNQV